MEKFTKAPVLLPVNHDPFSGPAVACTAPTTEAQREVWVAAQMGREAHCAYIESVSLELVGVLDRAALEQAFHLLVLRHEALRSTISKTGLRVVVQENMELPFGWTDLSGEPEAVRTERLAALAHADASTPFDLQHGPLFRVHVVRLAEDQHLLGMSGHHVLVDGWSLGLIIKDVSHLYSALVAGREPALPAADRFSDFALAQTLFARSPAHAQVERYWLSLFEGPVPQLELPTDRPRPQVKTFNGHRMDRMLDPALVRGLRGIATRCGASFVTALLASFEVFLYRLTGDRDLCVGLPAAGQSDLGMNELVGHCVNLLALRSRIDEDKPFMDYLKERRTAVLDAFDNQKYTLGTLVRRLNVPREPGRIPLCPVVFNIDMNLDDGANFEGLTHRFISNPREYEHFELFLNVTGSADGLVLEWSYNTDLFDESTVRGWMDGLNALLGRITEHAGQTIAELVADAPAEGATAAPEPRDSVPHEVPLNVPVHVLFDQVAALHGDRTALELQDQRRSYRELQQRADALGAHLIGLGVRPGDPVGICLHRGLDLITAMLATLRAGGCFVPFDPGYPMERLRFMLADTNVQVMLTQRALADALPPHQARTVLLEDIPRAVVDAPLPRVDGSAPAYIMYTSGSTGTPKGVVVPHRGIVRLVRGQHYLPFGPDLVFLQLSNISFDASTLEIWGALLNGARLVLQPQQQPTLAEIAQAIERHGVSTVWFSTGLFNLMVDEHLDRLRGLRHVLTGGDVLSVPHVKKALQVLGPGVLINGYGPTENTTFTTCHRIDSVPATGGIPIGRPLHHTTVHVLDAELRPVPRGRKGELYTGGAGVALGYWARPELTAAHFVPDPFSDVPGALLYRTGDLARWLPDGTLEFIGRGDGQVKVRGFRVELGEIENAVMAHDAVRDCVVVARRDPSGEQRLAAYVVPQDPVPLGDHATAGPDGSFTRVLHEHLDALLPGYMVPAFIIPMEQLPLNPNGKVDRSALPLPALRNSVMKAQHVEPRNEREQVVAGIWRKALGVDDIGVHDNFFDLGGHSLMGIQVLARVDQQLGRKLPLQALFQAPTVALLAAALGEQEVLTGPRHLAPLQRQGSKLPLFCVHGDEANHFLPRDLGDDQPFYAFFHQGEDGQPIRYTTVESIAAHFISELREAGHHGPFLLCGYSFGGLVAYEMAQQLTRDGEQVPFLALFDTYAPSEYGGVMAREARWHEPVKKAMMRGAVHLFRRLGKALPPKLRHFHIIDTYDGATRRYTPKPYAGPLLMIRSAESWGPQHMGWEGLVQEGLEVVVVPGDHFSMIKDPHAHALARHVAEGIRNATKQASLVV